MSPGHFAPATRRTPGFRFARCLWQLSLQRLYSTSPPRTFLPEMTAPRATSRWLTSPKLVRHLRLVWSSAIPRCLEGGPRVRARRSEVGVGGSRRGRGTWWGACLIVLALLGVAGCAPGSPGTVAAGGGCGSAPHAGAGGPMPFRLVDASAVPGRQQHFSCRNWSKVATFGRDIHLGGVAAVFH